MSLFQEYLTSKSLNISKRRKVGNPVVAEKILVQKRMSNLDDRDYFWIGWHNVGWRLTCWLVSCLVIAVNTQLWYWPRYLSTFNLITQLGRANIFKQPELYASTVTPNKNISENSNSVSPKSLAANPLFSPYCICSVVFIIFCIQFVQTFLFFKLS